MVPIMVDGAAAATVTLPTKFRARGATEPGRAIAWTPEGKVEASQFAKLVDQGALVEMRPGTWYLNEEKLAAARSGAGVVVVVLAGVVALGAGFLLSITQGG